MVLTHIDDVGDHEKYAERFGCTRVMHRGDYRERVNGVERWLDGLSPIALVPGVTCWPTPGHTEGSICLHVDDRFLFTGDTLAWHRDLAQLYAFRRACWHDWSILQSSVERIKHLAMEWVLPGHGSPVCLAGMNVTSEFERCLSWMDAQA